MQRHEVCDCTMARGVQLYNGTWCAVVLTLQIICCLLSYSIVLYISDSPVLSFDLTNQSAVHKATLLVFNRGIPIFGNDMINSKTRKLILLIKLDLKPHPTPALTTKLLLSLMWINKPNIVCVETQYYYSCFRWA